MFLTDKQFLALEAVSNRSIDIRIVLKLTKKRMGRFS
jgi:hypothetical protein